MSGMPSGRHGDELWWVMAFAIVFLVVVVALGGLSVAFALYLTVGAKGVLILVASMAAVALATAEVRRRLWRRSQRE